ncbi:hypothetical protein FRC12_023926 [Ceratobasidium sp. 428]|nr:hypothetical protein FRC12_023926 [Ceratobasidium sp. 428]
MEIDLSTLTRYLTPKRIFYTLLGLAVVKYRSFLYWPIYSWQSPLRHLNGPKNDNFFFGHFLKLLNEQSSTMYEEWVEKHGKTFRFRGFVGSYQLYTMDMRAVQHMMTQPSIFDRPEATRRGMKLMFGEGLLSVDPAAHKRQRRIMNPSFGALQIRNLLPVFWEKSNQLRDIWVDMLNNNPEGREVDALAWLNRATLDVIGSAGFGYEFNSLQNEDENELAKAFKAMFNASDAELTTMMMFEAVAYVVFGIPTKQSRKLNANLDTIRRIGMKIIADKKAMLNHDAKEDAELQGRDLLTLLIKSNMAEETKGTHENQSMSDNEVLGQISTFLAAGHETSGTATTWALYALTQHPEVQTRLRHELRSAGLGDEPSMADLDKLPYLDCVVRETLRAYSVVPNVGREVTVDTALPVGESFKDRYGASQTEIRRGDNILIPILAMNRSKDVWGEDAMEFRPERWENLPSSVKDMPGVWGNLMTFAHGAYSCIGYRFAVIEIKALLHSLVRSIEFSIDPEIEIESKTGTIATRPYVKSDPKKGDRMPLRCKTVTSA